jgi:hypothetical protein
MINPNPCPMNSAKLVKQQRRQQFYFMAVIILIVILTTFFFNLNTISISVLGTICIPIAQLWQMKKYHLNYDSNRIDWFCSNTNENKSIDLSEEKYLVNSDWRGFHFKGEKQEFNLSMDYVGGKDRENVLKELQDYYS